MAVFGCDIGNGFAYVSMLEQASSCPDRALPPNVRPEGMPTDAYIEPDGTVVIDEVVVKQEEDHSNCGRIVRVIKRHLDESMIALAPAVGIRDSSSGIEPRRVYAAIAQCALDQAFKFMVDERGREAIHDIVLTYPAILARTPKLIDVLSDAVGELTAPDGEPYKVIGRIPEPAAVALDFLAFMRHEVEEAKRIDRRDVTVVIYDLGHGTFDTALVTARAMEDGKEKPWEVHDYGGSPKVGGADFDRRIEELLEEAADEVAPGRCETGKAKSDIHTAAVKCKHYLTEVTSTSVAFMNDDAVSVERAVSREEFEDMTSDLVDETVDEVSRMFDTAHDLKLSVTHLVLSGGASRMPMVRTALEKLVGKRCDGQIAILLHRPSQAVSFGAARYGMQLERSLPFDRGVGYGDAPASVLSMRRAADLVQLVPRDIGIVVPENGTWLLRVLVKQGTSLPTTSERVSVDVEGAVTRVIVGCAREHRDATSVGTALPAEEFREMGRLWPAVPLRVGSYRLELVLDEDGSVSCLLYGEDGKAVRMGWI